MLLTSLPQGVLVHLMHFLNVSDKNSVMLTCRHLANVGSDPLIWSEVQIPKHKLTSDFNTLLTVPRLSMLRILKLGRLKMNFNLSLAKKLLNYINCNKNLKVLDLSQNDISCFPAFPLAEALSKVSILILSNCHLTTEQTMSLLKKISTNQQQCTNSLNVSFNSLKFIDANLLAETITRLLNINLSYTDLNGQKVQKIFDNVVHSRLQTLEVSGSHLGQVYFDESSKNLHLSTLAMEEVIINEDKLDLFMTSISSCLQNLTKLNLNQSVLTRVNPIIFADSVRKIEDVELRYCWLYKDHIEYLMDSITEKDSALRKLDLSGNHIEDVDKNLLLEGVNSLQVTVLQWCNLQPEHFQLLLEEQEEPIVGTVVISGTELIAKHPNLFRKAMASHWIEVNMDASHDPPSTDLKIDHETAL